MNLHDFIVATFRLTHLKRLSPKAYTLGLQYFGVSPLLNDPSREFFNAGHEVLAIGTKKE